MRIVLLAQDRGDLAEASKFLAQRMKTPRGFCWQQLKRVARYLVGRPAARLWYRAQKWHGIVTGFTDSDWASCPLTRKSTSGLAAFLGDHCVRTSSTLQSLTTLSVAESEFYALIKGAAFLLGLRSLLEDWGLAVQLHLRSDSSSAKSMADRQGIAKVKHMQTRFLWIQERIAHGDIDVSHIGTKLNCADLFTKAVARTLLDFHMKRIGLLYC